MHMRHSIHFFLFPSDRLNMIWILGVKLLLTALVYIFSFTINLARSLNSEGPPLSRAKTTHAKLCLVTLALGLG